MGMTEERSAFRPGSIIRPRRAIHALSLAAGSSGAPIETGTLVHTPFSLSSYSKVKES